MVFFTGLGLGLRLGLDRHCADRRFVGKGVAPLSCRVINTPVKMRACALAAVANSAEYVARTNALADRHVYTAQMPIFMYMTAITTYLNIDTITSRIITSGDCDRTGLETVRALHVPWRRRTTDDAED